MIDIHSHVVFDVDDGSRSLEESLEMLEIAAASGTKILVATPHSNMQGRFENYEYEGVCKKRFLELKKAAQKENIPVKLLRGTEIFGVGPVREAIEEKELVSLNRSGYYLIEFPFSMDGDEMTHGLHEVFRAGGKPVIAHPERYDCVQENPNLVFEWMSEGVLSQVNKGSLLGKFGRREERTARLLLDHQLVTCLASDAHSATMRTPYMKDIKEFLLKEYDQDTAKCVLAYFPGQILLGKPVPQRGITPIESRRRFFF